MKKLYLKASSFLSILTLMILSNPVHAQTIGDRIKSLGRDGVVFGNFMMLVVGVAGIVLLFLGIWGLKKNAENNQQNPLKVPLILIVAGGIMAGFTAFQMILSESFTGSPDDQNQRNFNAQDIG